MHTVTLVEQNRLYDVFKIDGVLVEMTKRMNKLTQRPINELVDVVDSLEDLVKHHSPLTSVVVAVNGTNTLRLLEALYFEYAYAWWEEEYPKRYSNGTYDYKSIFSDIFGFAPPAHMKRNSLVEAFHLFSKDYKDKIEHEKTCVSSERYRIEKVSVDGNVITYRINEKEIMLCLSGRKNMKHPSNMLKVLEMFEAGFKSMDSTTIKTTIKLVGPKASLSLIENFFAAEAETLFCKAIPKSILLFREKFYPRKIIKEYFGGIIHPFVDKLLDSLEISLPEIESLLVESSKDELLSNDRTWVLYYDDLNGAKQCVLNFAGNPVIVHECQQYLRVIADIKIMAEAPFVRSIESVNRQLQKIIGILDNELKINLLSIKDLTIWDVRMLKAYLSQASGFSADEQRRLLVYLRSFFDFISCQDCVTYSVDPFDGFSLPKGGVNLTTPISETVLDVIVENLHCLSRATGLILLTACSTGGRAESVCSVTVDDLYRDYEGYKLKIYSYKTATRNLASGKSPCTIHSIPEPLGELLFKYIEDTDELRKKLEQPYVFIYANNLYRDGTQRKPRVMTAHHFREEVNALIRSLQLYDEDGFPVSCSFMAIRAEVGRTLFSEGKTEYDVARKLGNTPEVARKHYHKEYPHEEAERYNEQYKITIEKSLKEAAESDKNVDAFAGRHEEMYGHCHKDSCNIKNDCETCPQRIVCRSQKNGGILH